jgi:hypothetical protein
MPRCLDKRKFQEYFLCIFRESNENNSNSNGISNGHKEEKKVTQKAWSPALKIQRKYS